LQEVKNNNFSPIGLLCRSKEPKNLN
jgi:hypothetical protein